MKKSQAGFCKRLWIYQAERFPLGKTGILLLAFSASSVSASAQLAGRSLPALTAYLTAFCLSFCFFWQLRAADEYKDRETDALYRPWRPIPRGLVSLRLILSLGLASMAIAACVAYAYLPRLLWLILLVWGWMGLMTVEFFARQRLHQSPLLLLASHMLIMPLIDLVLTAVEWLPHTQIMPEGLWTFLALSLANGCIIELGRKIWAPENEGIGIETYSRAWGITRSLMALLTVWLIAYGSLLALGFYHHMAWIFGLIGLMAASHFLAQIILFARQPTPVRQQALDNSAGIWVLSCYLLAALLPLTKGWMI